MRVKLDAELLNIRQIRPIMLLISVLWIDGKNESGEASIIAAFSATIEGVPEKAFQPHPGCIHIASPPNPRCGATTCWAATLK